MNKIVWIVLILAGVALLFWLVFGINWRSKQNYDRKHHLLRSRMQAEDTEELRRLLFSNGLTMRVEQRFQPLTMLLARGGRPSVSLSTPQIITSGKDKYNMLMSDLICAKESIHMEYFHFGIDKSSRKIRQVLMEKARQGVKVRFNKSDKCRDLFFTIICFNKKLGRNFTKTDFGFFIFSGKTIGI